MKKESNNTPLLYQRMANTLPSIKSRSPPPTWKMFGKAATMDDITEAMDLGKSMRNMIIGLIIGLGVGAFILGPIITGMMK